MIVANNKTANLSTRGWPTANVALWLKSKGLLKEGVLDYEPDESRLITEQFVGAETFWDVGAQIGFYSILACLYGVKNVVAIETDSRYCKEIEKHAKANKLEILTKCIATGISGEVVEFKNYAKITKRKAVSLDEIWTQTNKKPDIIKMDIDGGEYKTICGAGKLLSGHDAPKLIIELLDQHSDVTALRSKIESFGYKLKDRVGNNALFVK